MGNADFLAEDGCLERLWREVALHLADVLLTEELEVFQCGVFLVIDGNGAHLVERLVEPFEVIGKVRGDGLPLLFERGDALLGLPNLVYRAFDGVDKFLVHLLLVVEEPRAFGGLRHIREHHHGVVKAMVSEVRADAAVGWQRLVFELVVVNEFRLVNEEPRERERVGRAGAVLADDDSHRAIVERDDVLVVGRFGDGLGERLGRFATDNVVNTIEIAPPLPCGEQAGERVGESVLEGRHDDAACRAGHTLHIAEHEGRGDGVRLAGASSGNDDGGLGGDVLREELGLVEVDALGVELGFGVPKSGVNFVHCRLA